MEEQAKRFLKKWGIRQPPVDVAEIALMEGIELHIAPIGMPTCCARVDGRRIIWVNRTDPVTRRRFRIAHEIFEFFDYSEQECDAGAAFLLMPPDWVEKYAPKVKMDLLSLAKIFRVSHEAMAYRLAGLFSLTVTILDFQRLTVRLGGPLSLLPIEKKAIQWAYQERNPRKFTEDDCTVYAFPIPPFPPSRVILFTGNALEGI